MSTYYQSAPVLVHAHAYQPPLSPPQSPPHGYLPFYTSNPMMCSTSPLYFSPQMVQPLPPQQHYHMYPSTSAGPGMYYTDFNPHYVQIQISQSVSHDKILAGGPKDNCTVARGRKTHVDHRQLSIEKLHPLLLQFKLTTSELETNAYPMRRDGSTKAVSIADTVYTQNKKMFLDDYDMSRNCSRCNKEFKLSPNGTMIRSTGICRYHNRGVAINGKRDTFRKRYSCCNEEFNVALGCKFSDVHVTDQLFKKELSTFVSTPVPVPNDQRSTRVYALDCEMVYTIAGPALARLTMVDMQRNRVLDVFVKPPTDVLDPNTEFSGLTMEQINSAPDTLKTCHQKLFKYVNADTILIGHSLESDLKAMRVVHKNVIDTAILFRSTRDTKVALKVLSAKLLHKNIQGDNEDAIGHDSMEDALTCVDLIFYGLRNPESIAIREANTNC